MGGRPGGLFLLISYRKIVSLKAIVILIYPTCTMVDVLCHVEIFLCVALTGCSHYFVKLLSVRKELKKIRAVGTEAVIYNKEENGKDIGMVINEKETQSICISACNYHDVRSEIHTRCALISNNAPLKVLGVVFDNHPTLLAHIENVSIKFRDQCGR